jgi:hypothetical protein
MRLTLHPYALRAKWRLTLLPPPKGWEPAPEVEVEIDGCKLSSTNVRGLCRVVEKYVAVLGDEASPEALSVLRLLRSKAGLSRSP